MTRVNCCGRILNKLSYQNISGTRNVHKIEQSLPTRKDDVPFVQNLGWENLHGSKHFYFWVNLLMMNNDSITRLIMEEAC